MGFFDRFKKQKPAAEPELNEHELKELQARIEDGLREMADDYFTSGELHELIAQYQANPNGEIDQETLESFLATKFVVMMLVSGIPPKEDGTMWTFQGIQWAGEVEAMSIAAVKRGEDIRLPIFTSNDELAKWEKTDGQIPVIIRPADLVTVMDQTKFDIEIDPESLQYVMTPKRMNAAVKDAAAMRQAMN